MAKQRWHYFVGDIHGCYEEYRRLEDKIVRHAEQHDADPLIISVGDLVDRGPDSAKVVEHFYKGSLEGTHAAVMGNHEAFMLTTWWEFAPWDKSLGVLPHGMQSLRTKFNKGEGYARNLPWEDYRMFCRYVWTGQGGYEALASFDCDPDDPSSWEIDPDLLKFLLELPFVWKSEDYLVSHATATQEQLQQFYTFEDRSDTEDDETWEKRLRAYEELCNQLIWQRSIPEEAPDPNRIHLSGHTPVDRVKRSLGGKVRHIDTGCIYGRRLTAWCGEGNKYFRATNISGAWGE